MKANRPIKANLMFKYDGKHPFNESLKKLATCLTDEIIDLSICLSGITISFKRMDGESTEDFASRINQLADNWEQP